MKLIFNAALVCAALFFSTPSFADLDDGINAMRLGDYDAALIELHPLAEAQNAYAQYLLGEIYSTGKGVPVDLIQGLYWYQESAEQGFADSQMYLGNYYSKNAKSPKELLEAINWYELAATHKQVDGIFREEAIVAASNLQLQLGKLYYSGESVQQDYQEAANYFQHAAENGNIDAQMLLGAMYLQGKGIARNLQKAKHWFEEAAEKDNPYAQNNLANMYLAGQGTDKDLQKGRDWLEKSANNGFSQAQYNLGLIYESGTGVNPDKEIALSWYKKAAEQGLAAAESKIIEINKIEISDSLDISDINPIIKKEDSWYSLLVFEINNAKKGFGFWGVLLVIFLAGASAQRYFVYRKAKKFLETSMYNLALLGKNIPVELKKSLFLGRVGLFFAMFTTGIFLLTWVMKDYTEGVVWVVLSLSLGGLFFARLKLINNLSLSISQQEGFFNASSLLVSANILKKENAFEKVVAKITESDKEKAKKEKKKNELTSFAVAVLACKEAAGKVEGFNLDGNLYFAGAGYIQDFSKTVINKIKEKDKNYNDGKVKIKNIVKEISAGSCLEKEEAYDLAIGYFPNGRAFVQQGVFYFYTQEYLPRTVLCACCGQVVSSTSIDDELDEQFCGDICKQQMQRLLEDSFQPDEIFVELGNNIYHGIDRLLTVSTGLQNEELFANRDQDDSCHLDRIVNDQEFQVKFFKTAELSISEAFSSEDGTYRYIASDGNPVAIEFPSDQFSQAVLSMRKKWNKIPGLSSPEQAEGLVKKGVVTYNQAKNIARFDIIEGLHFYLQEGVVESKYKTPISFCVNFAKQCWITKNPNLILQEHAVAAAKKITTILLVSQLQSVKNIITTIGVPKNAENLLTKGLEISGSKLKNPLGGAMAFNVAIISISASKDVYHLMNNKISGGQFFKTTLTNASGVFGGSAGALVVGAVAGKVLGGTLGAVAGPAGAFFGAAVCSHLSTMATKAVLDEYIDDDGVAAKRLTKYQIKYLAEEYMLTAEEVDVIVTSTFESACQCLPNSNAIIQINSLILPHVIFLVKNRPKIAFENMTI